MNPETLRPVTTDLDIPVLPGAQRQGDILVLPTEQRTPAKPEPIPPSGIVVVRGEATDHTHTLLGEGTWTPLPGPADLGIADITGTAYLIHPEHAALGIGAGRYVLRRQREHTPSGPQHIDD